MCECAGRDIGQHHYTDSEARHLATREWPCARISYGDSCGPVAGQDRFESFTYRSVDVRRNRCDPGRDRRIRVLAARKAGGGARPSESYSLRVVDRSGGFPPGLAQTVDHIKWRVHIRRPDCSLLTV